MEWAIGIGIGAMLLLCPLMMLGMIVGGWILGRSRISGHGGHSMMCMPHGSDDRGEPTGAADPDSTVGTPAAHQLEQR